MRLFGIRYRRFSSTIARKTASFGAMRESKGEDIQGRSGAFEDRAMFCGMHRAGVASAAGRLLRPVTAHRSLRRDGFSANGYFGPVSDLPRYVARRHRAGDVSSRQVREKNLR